ncbi:DUF397 domain-containing protein [Saccharopolyspora endophytica]|uniref:DUF397 domain-containing protein n=1 Tax=Saccharopolyspora endophytica TaxID=543886 RepID=A0ABS5DJZ3_9PSEU|nr:DUF397 domain-containing protein [Saccharopolyspora endophytica]MBQ0926612.1 DUF397 domain-containing protein [Saccharopolyspora endophytica]
MTTVPRPGVWRKSSYSAEKNCVEVGRVGDGAAVRDTKNRDQGFFTATRAQWTAFIDAAKGGQFDRPE